MSFGQRYLWFSSLFLIPSLACTQEVGPPGPTSRVEGVITVNAEIDSTRDYSGIEVLVTAGREAGADTLGIAVTDTDGRFAMDVAADDRGVFPLVIMRGGTVLNVSQLVVAPSDTVSVTAQFPLGRRIPLIKSYENSAWTAFRNAEAAHSERITEMLASGEASGQELRRSIVQASEILWSIPQTYPGTMAADVAAAKSVVMLDGWNDSLLVARLGELNPEAPGFAESVQAAGRAEARLHGLEAGIALLREMKARAVGEEPGASIQREIAQAYLDMGNREKAVAAAESLKTNYPGTGWEEWANRAQYEANNLLPGMPAPGFSLATREGGHVDLDSLSGKLVVLEFWAPRDRQAAQQLSEIAKLVASDGWSLGLAWVSVGLEADDELYEAFFEEREVPGIQVRDTPEAMQDLIARYNVETVPTRYLIGPDGLIRAKYTGNRLLELSADIENMAAETKGR